MGERGEGSGLFSIIERRRMIDISRTIIPKSDQLNFDDFICGQTKTINITDVTGKEGDQPVSIHYEGGEGKPYKPSKGMRRVIANAWGMDTKIYIGRSISLYGDPTVKFGGMEQGGIRISHMSHIAKSITLAVTETRGRKKPFTVHPIDASAAPSLSDMLSDISTAPNGEGLEFKFKTAYKTFTDAESRAKLVAAKDRRKAEIKDA